MCSESVMSCVVKVLCRVQCYVICSENVMCFAAWSSVLTSVVVMVHAVQPVASVHVMQAGWERGVSDQRALATVAALPVLSVCLVGTVII
jgi:hypothetical protein